MAFEPLAIYRAAAGQSFLLFYHPKAQVAR
jgi:hypothetical protein